MYLEKPDSDFPGCGYSHLAPEQILIPFKVRTVFCIHTVFNMLVCLNRFKCDAQDLLLRNIKFIPHSSSVCKWAIRVGKGSEELFTKKGVHIKRILQGNLLQLGNVSTVILRSRGQLLVSSTMLHVGTLGPQLMFCLGKLWSLYKVESLLKKWFTGEDLRFCSQASIPVYFLQPVCGYNVASQCPAHTTMPSLLAVPGWTVSL